MKKFAIISCVLMLIINCCTQKKEKSEIEKDLKSHRAKINQRIQKTLKEKISILNMDLLTIILILLSTTTVLQILTIIYLIWRK